MKLWEWVPPNPSIFRKGFTNLSNLVLQSHIDKKTSNLSVLFGSQMYLLLEMIEEYSNLSLQGNLEMSVWEKHSYFNYNLHLFFCLKALGDLGGLKIFWTRQFWILMNDITDIPNIFSPNLTLNLLLSLYRDLNLTNHKFNH